MKKLLTGVLLTVSLSSLYVVEGCSNHASTGPVQVEGVVMPKVSQPDKPIRPKSAKKKQKLTMFETLEQSKKPQLTYCAFGDSLSVGLFSEQKTRRFSTQLASSLQQQLHRKVIEKNTSAVGKTVTNFGIGHVEDVINAKPDLVTIEFGTNDAAYGTYPLNFNNFSNNLDATVSRIRHETQAQILLLTTWSSNKGKYIESDRIYDQKIKEIRQRYGVTVVDLSQIWKNNPEVTRNDQGMSKIYNIQKDEFHPNQYGHDQIVSLLEKTINNTKVK